MPMKLEVGDVLTLKKNHPCGGREFEVMRAGMDFRIKCLKCGSQTWMDRPKLEKSIVKVVQNENILY
jgi:hypothetical protein